MAARDCGGGFNKKTSLMIAARDNTPEVAAMVLDCSCTQQAIDAVDQHGRTALMSAALHGSLEVARVLVAAGAELDTTDCDGRNALELAEQGPSAGLRQLLTEETAQREAFLAQLLRGPAGVAEGSGGSGGAQVPISCSKGRGSPPKCNCVRASRTALRCPNARRRWYAGPAGNGHKLRGRREDCCGGERVPVLARPSDRATTLGVPAACLRKRGVCESGCGQGLCAP